MTSPDKAIDISTAMIDQVFIFSRSYFVSMDVVLPDASFPSLDGIPR